MRLRDDDDVDDLVGIRVDDANAVPDDKVAITTVARHNDDDVSIKPHGATVL